MWRVIKRRKRYGLGGVSVALSLLVVGCAGPVARPSGTNEANPQPVHGPRAVSGPGTAQASLRQPSMVVLNTPVGERVGPHAVGVNTAAWDPLLLARATQDELIALNQPMLRFPGGSFADQYHWQTNTINPGTGRVSVTYQAFVHFMQQLHSPAMITLNYGSNASATGGGSPSSAADLVKYLNAQLHAGIQYFEIGNEIYGSWETDLHANPSNPLSYAHYAAPFVQAVRAQDAGAKIGIPVTVGFNQVQYPNWNAEVLRSLGQTINFVDVHWYPFHGSIPAPNNQDLLHSLATIPGAASQLKAELRRYSPQSQFVVGETNLSADIPTPISDSYPSALFAAADILSWLQSGAQYVLWWDLHNDTGGGKDYGMLTSGPGQQTSRLPVNSPFPVYFGVYLAANLVGQGGQFLTVQQAGTSSASSAVQAAGAGVAGKAASPVDGLLTYAFRRLDGSLALLMVNLGSKSRSTEIQFPTSARAPFPSVSHAAILTYTLHDSRQILTGSKTLNNGQIRLSIPANSMIELSL